MSNITRAFHISQQLPSYVTFMWLCGYKHDWNNYHYLLQLMMQHTYVVDPIKLIPFADT